MTKLGDPAPEIVGTTADGRPFRLSEWRGSHVVLYFYPKAFTRGCASETRGFSAIYPELRQRNVQLAGISVDAPETQRRFADECRADFPMIPDRAKEIARSYGILGLIGLAKRVTFVIGPDGRVIDLVQSILPDPHLRRVRDTLLAGRLVTGPDGSTASTGGASHPSS
ncbi:MAG: peroxiredoxin [Thermoplasmata archaeon]|nr:peroxiredoxin [Thermoplasmata archaeon]MCI4344092.1 peroxiredoxin [Thermoplasmata archaeon]